MAPRTAHFSEGIEKAHAEHERMGSFADTDCPLCRARLEAERATGGRDG